MKKFLVILVLVTALMVSASAVSADPGGGTNPNGGFTILADPGGGTNP